MVGSASAGLPTSAVNFLTPRLIRILCRSDLFVPSDPSLPTSSSGRRNSESPKGFVANGKRRIARGPPSYRFIRILSSRRLLSQKSDSVQRGGPEDRARWPLLTERPNHHKLCRGLGEEKFEAAGHFGSFR
jgi:hypothetical protein